MACKAQSKCGPFKDTKEPRSSSSRTGGDLVTAWGRMAHFSGLLHLWYEARALFSLQKEQGVGCLPSACLVSSGELAPRAMVGLTHHSGGEWRGSGGSEGRERSWEEERLGTSFVNSGSLSLLCLHYLFDLDPDCKARGEVTSLSQGAS